MPIRTLDDLRVFREAQAAALAVSALFETGPLARDAYLKTQMVSAAGSVGAQIAEGFGQLTDRHFAHYLAISRGSCNEMQAHLHFAFVRGQIDRGTYADLSERYRSLGRQLTRLIQYLRESNRLQRG